MKNADVYKVLYIIIRLGCSLLGTFDHVHLWPCSFVISGVFPFTNCPSSELLVLTIPLCISYWSHKNYWDVCMYKGLHSHWEIERLPLPSMWHKQNKGSYFSWFFRHMWEISSHYILAFFSFSSEDHMASNFRIFSKLQGNP